jgi:hypothetical protein
MPFIRRSEAAGTKSDSLNKNVFALDISALLLTGSIRPRALSIQPFHNVDAHPNSSIPEHATVLTSSSALWYHKTHVYRHR